MTVYPTTQSEGGGVPIYDTAKWPTRETLKVHLLTAAWGLSFSEDIQPGQRDHVDTVADAAPRAGRQDTGVPLSERQDGDQHPRVLVHPLHPL